METEEKTEKKYMSRKFIVWIAATLFVVAAFVLSFVLKNERILEIFAPYWGGVSMLYIGGNVAQDFAYNMKPKQDQK